MILKAMDVSSHQPRNLSGLIAQYKPQHVIVKGYLEVESVSSDHSKEQVQSAWDNGCTAGMYAWCYWSVSPYTTIDNIIELCASIGLELPLLWLDCETYGKGANFDPGPDADWLAKAVEYSETKYQMACGLYTGLWWIDGHFPGGQGEFGQFSRLPLWLSQYEDADPENINYIRLPQGWSQVAAKQYQGYPIDLSVIREEYTVYQSQEPPPPPLDPCENLKLQLQAWRDRKPYKAITKTQLKGLNLGG